jgi:hypothetical protein
MAVHLRDQMPKGVHGNQQLVVIPEVYTDGMITRWQPQFLADTAYSFALNADLDDLTRPRRRDGYSKSGIGTGDLDNLTSRPSGGVYFNPSSVSSRKIFMAVNAHNAFYYATSLSGNWTNAQTGAAADIDPNSDDCVMFQVGDVVFALRGSGEVASFNSSGVGLLSTGTGNSPPVNGVDGFSFLNRAWILASGDPPKLYYSILLPTAAGIDTQWERTTPSATSGFFSLAPEIGNRPVAARPWNNQSIVVWFEGSIEEVIPGSDFTASSSFYTGAIRRVIEPKIGCCSRDGVVSSGQDFYFPDQFGQIRSLAQTVTADQAGVVSEPLSDRIKSEIPGRVNTTYLSKIRSVIFRDKLLVAYPRDGATEANAVAVFSLTHKIWTSIWVFPRPIGRWMVSNLAGIGDELYFFDGGTTSNPTTAAATYLYRMFRSTYLDDTAAIPFTFDTKAFDFGRPDLNKHPHDLEVEIRADHGCSIEVFVQPDENGRWEELEESPVLSPSTGGTWISYTLTYPLVAPVTALVRRTLPMSSDEKSRFHRFRVYEDTGGKQVALTGLRFAAQPLAYQPATEENN